MAIRFRETDPGMFAAHRFMTVDQFAGLLVTAGIIGEE